MSISASEARRTLFPLIERINADRDAVEIVSRRGNAVLMPADEYAAWQETAYLFRSPANARRLLDSYERARAGKVEEHEASIKANDASRLGQVSLGGLQALADSRQARAETHQYPYRRMLTRTVRGHRKARAAEVRRTRGLVAAYHR